MSLSAPDPATPIVITGASSGIGAEIARGLSRRGHHLVLVARRADRLDELAEELRGAHGVQVQTLPLDLADAADRARLIGRITEHTPAGVVNSAGFGTSGPFQSLPLDREREQVAVNALALMELTHAALPGMIERGSGAVLNIGSVAGFQPLPDAAVYSATKAFVQTFSEAVHEGLSGTGVSCSTLCPGPVSTEWWEVAGATVSPQSGLGPLVLGVHEVAEAGIAAMLAGKRLVVPGLGAKAMATGGKFAPRSVLLPLLRRAADRRE